MFGGFFFVLAYTFLLILVGAQAWYIIFMGADDEAGLPRLLIRPLIIVAPGAGFYFISIRPDLLPVALAIMFLPLAIVWAGRFLVARFWDRRERDRLAREIETWESILARNPGHPTARLVLGDRYRDLGEKEKARFFYRQALEKSNDPLRARQELEELDRPVLSPAPTFGARERRAVLKVLARWPLYLLLAVAAVFVSMVLVVLLVFVLRRSPIWLSFMVLIILPLYFFLRWLAS